MLVINCINITDINNDNYQLLRNAVSEERRSIEEEISINEIKLENLINFLVNSNEACYIRKNSVYK